jgi:hypothetical protein
MHTADPVTLFVASCVVPTALATCLIWSAYLIATGASLSSGSSRHPVSWRRP